MASIQALRKAAHISRNELAEKAVIDPFRLCEIESGRAPPTPDEERAVRKALRELLKERAIRFYDLLLRQETT